MFWYCLLFVCVVLVCNVCTAADKELTGAERSLKGLTGVEVVVSDPDADERRAGLTKAVLKTAVELRLRRNGIKVLSKGAALKTRAMAEIYIEINNHHSGDGLVAVAFIFELRQAVTTKHGQRVMGATWSRGSVAAVGRSKFKRASLESIADFTDQFSNAYLKANTKK